MVICSRITLGILQDIMNGFCAKELAVKIIAFDGQFLEIVLSRMTPLTLCRLQKIVCQDPTKLSKKEVL